MNDLIYTGIGSRETPSEIQDLMARIAFSHAEAGMTLRSGHADGADLAFEQGCMAAGGRMEIFLPWSGFNRATQAPVYRVINSPEAAKLAAHFHPAWGRCSAAARALHTRNVHQVLGADLKTPTRFVVCWTQGGRRAGGTGQALRIADAYHIPIFDLAVCSPEQLLEFVESL